MNELKTHYSAQELVDLKLKTLPTTKKAVLTRAQKQNWNSRKRVGKGGGVEYALSSLPDSVQSELRDRFALSVVSKPKKLPTVKNINLDDLTDKQRQIADARMALVVYVAELEQVQSRKKAIDYFCNAAKCGEISADLMTLVSIANAKNGNNCGRVLCPRTLNQWVLDYHKCQTAEERLRALAPGKREATKLEELAWLPDFLAAYRNTNGINVTEAYPTRLRKPLAV